MTLTIAYMTCRKNPRFEWFADSIRRQNGFSEIELLVIDFYADERDLSGYARSIGLNSRSHTPKPTVWQGAHRLTKANYFAAANARNTAIALAKHSYIAFVDDLSVAAPTWLESVNEAASSNRIVCGSYQKVKKLVVSSGVVSSFERYFEGEDPRRLRHSDPVQRQCPPDWFYGCSCGAPIEAMLAINGYPEMCDGMGYEDSETGKTLFRAGYRTWFAPLMKTFESEEAHHEEPPFLRLDPGVSPNDKSHAMLANCRNARRFENYFGPEGLRGLRERVQAGEPFPVMTHPTTDWFTGELLAEMPHA